MGSMESIKQIETLRETYQENIFQKLRRIQNLVKHLKWGFVWK